MSVKTKLTAAFLAASSLLGFQNCVATGEGYSRTYTRESITVYETTPPGCRNTTDMFGNRVTVCNHRYNNGYYNGYYNNGYNRGYYNNGPRVNLYITPAPQHRHPQPIAPRGGFHHHGRR